MPEKNRSAMERMSWIAGIVGTLVAVVALVTALTAPKDAPAPVMAADTQGRQTGGTIVVNNPPPSVPEASAPMPVVAPAAPPSVTGEGAIPAIYGRTYDDARAMLIEAGWIPAKHHWTFGDSIDVKEGNGPIFWKREYWEVHSCAGTGAANCLFRFTDPSGRVLMVVTEGEESDDGSYHATVARHWLLRPGDDAGE